MHLLMKCMYKLSRLPITFQNLETTGIGRVVNNLRKYKGSIGESAKTLIIQWKTVVKIEETENFYKRDDNSDEENLEVSSPRDNEEFIFKKE
ncbi:transcription elongation factor B polypeptide 3-like isoform X1 [Aphis craccivora]|uniref:Transcription elongation factor B polypeptide 3-like isoform X1 n=1 Tax=Aphis craccivora TaxID=307492 RepID=A0A6G0YD29_APHCR|nr:transcription elongation factor B polypeptide 3-like isoform X1 [Aphis craccivora]